jgi:VWFA-related protein
VRVVVASGVLALVAAAAAQTQQPPQQPTFRTGTNLVQVDVIVTGGDGEPIDDLTADDFQIFDEGRAVPIAAFKFVNVANSEPRERYPVRTADDEEREAANEDTRLVAILLDDYHVGRFEPRRFVEPLIALVRSLPPSDLVGVYYPLDSPRDVHLTYDRQAAIAAIRKFEGRAREYFSKHPVEEEHMRYPRDIERLRTQVVLTGAVSLMSRLGALKVGRKTLVWITNGFTPAGYSGSGIDGLLFAGIRLDASVRWQVSLDQSANNAPESQRERARRLLGAQRGRARVGSRRTGSRARADHGRIQADGGGAAPERR